MTWTQVATTVAIVQGISTMVALYLSVLSLRHTARGVQTAVYEHAARMSPHISVYGRVEVGFGLAAPRVSLTSTNDGIGPAINVTLVCHGVVETFNVSSTDVCLTRSGGAAILRPGDSVHWAARGSDTSSNDALPLLITCRDAEGGEWQFSYTLEFPEHGGPITMLLEHIDRPRGSWSPVTVFGGTGR
jgi:hypothetical protein